ncbi:MAG: methyltransferase domain-containing protein [Hamadaea sp.]|nr:methyltransferase domain-containing protein [Hamadaea sp.]
MSTPNRQAALDQYGKIASYYDYQIVFRGMRAKGIAALGLQAGQTVLEAGCGTGINFARLRAGVGPTGQVYGIDQSPLMLRQARGKISRHGWTNVEVFESPLEEAQLPLLADALLFSFTHDLSQIPAAVDSAMAKVRPGGRVVAICTHWDEKSAPKAATTVIKRLSDRYMTTYDGYDEPWHLIVRHLTGVAYTRHWFGTMYIVSGVRTGDREETAAV